MDQAYYSIGVDVGGTNTDAVILEHPSKRVVNFVKTTTTEDFSTGVLKSIQNVIVGQNQISENQISCLMLGTTAFINALIQGSQELSSVILIRICGPATRSFEPFTSFPKHLTNIIKSQIYYLDGGYEYNGKEIVPFQKKQVEVVAQEIVANYKQSHANIAIIGVFSPVVTNEDQQEIQTKQILKQVFKEAGFKNYSLTLSHKIGSLGFIERENATILNASLKPLAKKTISKFRDELIQLNLKNCNNVFLTQNDGTLISCDEAIKHPIFTLNSGPTNSLRGACELASEKSAIVVDIGGTTADLAFLDKGFPKETSTYVEIAGVRTNFRMPNVYSIGLGGGSIIKFDENDECSVGPQSVGYKLKKAAKCFGGSILTATDIAIAQGIADFDNANKQLIHLTKKQIDSASKAIISKLEEAVDHVKTIPGECAIILVGGGSILISENAHIKGINQIIKPKFFEVANAIGASIAQISGQIFGIENFTGKNKEEIVKFYKQKAKDKVINNGANPNSVEVIIDLTPNSYSQGESAKITCKAIGNLNIEKMTQNQIIQREPSKIGEIHIKDENIENYVEDIKQFEQQEIMELKPPVICEIDGIKQWVIQREDVECMSLGAAILGTGGGGSAYLGKMELLATINKGHHPRIIKVCDMKDDEFALMVAYYGAPTAIFEKLSGGQMVVEAIIELKLYLEMRLNKKLGAVYCAEIGGLNSLVPIQVGAMLDLPILDCDCMGRAFPEFQMITPNIYGFNCLPICMTDIQKQQFILTSVPGQNMKNAEKFLRKSAMDYGLDMGIAGTPMLKFDLERIAVKGTISQIWRLGRAIIQARKLKINPLKVIEEKENGKLIFIGKIVLAKNLVVDGYNRGEIIIEGLDQFKNQLLYVDLQNENLRARLVCQNDIDGIQSDSCSEEKVVAIVPDLICIVDTERYQPILTEELRYGLRVSVLHLPCCPLINSKKALKVVGPKAFGFKNQKYHSTLQYIEPKCVLDD